MEGGDDDVEVDEESDGDATDGLNLLELAHPATVDECDTDADDLEYVKGEPREDIMPLLKWKRNNDSRGDGEI